MSITTKTAARSIVVGAALLAGSATIVTQSHAGNVYKPRTTVGGIEVSTVPLQVNPLKCESSGSPSEVPHALITNVSGAPIVHGKMISYKFISGLEGTYKLTTDLPSKGSFVTSESNEAGFKCSAKIL